MRWAQYYAKTSDRPPRRTLVRALDLFDAEARASSTDDRGKSAIDLGCGGGRDTVEILRRGWSVLAIDAEPDAIDHLLARSGLPNAEHLTAICARLEQADLPQSTLINSSFALPLCPPEVFHPLWHRITRALEPGGRFAGQFFGIRDSWNTGPDAKEGFTFLSAQGARDLLAPFETEMFEEEEDDSTTPRGKRKHWHVFNIVARKP